MCVRINVDNVPNSQPLPTYLNLGGDVVSNTVRYVKTSKGRHELEIIEVDGDGITWNGAEEECRRLGMRIATLEEPQLYKAAKEIAREVT